MADAQGYDSSLVETIVGQVKSQGIFDQFRRECLEDGPPAPAFQNLRQLVENTVKNFLSQQEWTPELNKNQLRERLRRNIIEKNFLEVGVERIVDQVVNPKITVFRPSIEEMVYKHLGIERPKVEQLEPPGLSSPPPPPTPPPPPPPIPEPPTNDLETVSSPDSNHSASQDDDDDHHHKTGSPLHTANGPKKESPPDQADIKMEVDDEESPPFEPIISSVKPPNEDSSHSPIKAEDSQESHISGLTSQDSVESQGLRVEEAAVPKNENAEAELIAGTSGLVLKEEGGKAEVTESSSSSQLLPIRDDSQLSQVSSDTQNSLNHNTSTDEPLDISEEAQMPSLYPKPEPGNEVVTSFDLQKEPAITFEQAKRENGDPTTSPSDPTAAGPDAIAATESQESVATGVGVEPPPLTADSGAPLCPSGAVNKIHVGANVTDDNDESLLDSGDSMDLKIVESDSRGSASASNTTTDPAEVKKDNRSSSSHRRSRHGIHHHRSSSSSASHHRSSKKSSSTTKERSRHRSRDHHKSSDGSKGSRRDLLKRPKEKEKKSNGDSCRRPVERRSTDRDSNDGASSGEPKKGTAASDKPTHAPTASTSAPPPAENQKQDTSTHSSKSETKKTAEATSPTPSDTNGISDRLQQPVCVDQLLDGKEFNLAMRASTPTTPADPAVPALKKPKIANNLKEAMKLMKVRKMMDLQRSKEEERAAVASKRAASEGLVDSFDEDGEASLHYFPDDRVVARFPESESEKWWHRIKAQDEEKELVAQVKEFLQDVVLAAPPPPAKKQKLQETTRPVNGLGTTTTTTSTGDFVDMDDYQETEVVLDVDLSAPPPLTENNNVQTENKNYGMAFNKLVNGDAELELTSVPAPETTQLEKNRAPKAPVSQRYTSEDLYKPRPGICGRSRRSRALDGPRGVDG